MMASQARPTNMVARTMARPGNPVLPCASATVAGRRRVESGPAASGAVDRKPDCGDEQAVPKPVVLIAEQLAPAAVDLLGSEVEIRHVDGANRDALLPALKEADAVLIRSATKIDAEALAAAPQLKVVARAGIGLDNVDVPAATAKGVLVVNAPQSNIITAAEHAVALLLSAARKVPA